MLSAPSPEGGNHPFADGSFDRVDDGQEPRVHTTPGVKVTRNNRNWSVSWARRPTSRHSEFFFEGLDVQFVCPCAAILVRQIPERVCDCRRLQEVFILRCRSQLPQERHVDTAVDIDVSDVNTLRMKIPRHHLSQATYSELG